MLVLWASGDDLFHESVREVNIFDKINKSLGVHYVYDKRISDRVSTQVRADIQNMWNEAVFAIVPRTGDDLGSLGYPC